MKASNSLILNHLLCAVTVFFSAHAISQPPPPGGGGSVPPPPVPIENLITEEKRVLGKILFWDEQLSSDNTVACGTCHIPTAAGGDPRPGAHPGADGVFGTVDDVVGSPGVVRRDSNGLPISDPTFGFGVQVTGRHAPNFFAGIWGDQQFWDGRAESEFLDPITGTVVIPSGGALESQSVAPILSSVEMAKDGRTWTEVIEKIGSSRPLQFATNLPADVQAVLSGSPSGVTMYGDLFEAAFGDPGINPVRIAFALATYERTLVADQTPFDLGTLTLAQQQGFDAGFAVDTAPNCGRCHAPPLFENNAFRNIGVRPPGEDIGRQEVTGDPADLGRFKTPSLRNAALKPAFMHNGSLTTLADVIAFYEPGGQNSTVNLDPSLPIALPPASIPNVIDFIENGLTDPRVVAGTFPFDFPTNTAAGAIVEENVPLPPLMLLMLSVVLLLIRVRLRI